MRLHLLSKKPYKRKPKKDYSKEEVRLLLEAHCLHHMNFTPNTLEFYLDTTEDFYEDSLIDDFENFLDDVFYNITLVIINSYLSTFRKFNIPKEKVDLYLYLIPFDFNEDLIYLNELFNKLYMDNGKGFQFNLTLFIKTIRLKELNRIKYKDEDYYLNTSEIIYKIMHGNQMTELDMELIRYDIRRIADFLLYDSETVFGHNINEINENNYLLLKIIKELSSIKELLHYYVGVEKLHTFLLGKDVISFMKRIIPSIIETDIINVAGYQLNLMYKKGELLSNISNKDTYTLSLIQNIKSTVENRIQRGDYIEPQNAYYSVLGEPNTNTVDEAQRASKHALKPFKRLSSILLGNKDYKEKFSKEILYITSNISYVESDKIKVRNMIDYLKNKNLNYHSIDVHSIKIRYNELNFLINPRIIVELENQSVIYDTTQALSVEFTENKNTEVPNFIVDLIKIIKENVSNVNKESEIKLNNSTGLVLEKTNTLSQNSIPKITRNLQKSKNIPLENKGIQPKLETNKAVDNQKEANLISNIAKNLYGEKARESFTISLGVLKGKPTVKIETQKGVSLLLNERFIYDSRNNKLLIQFKTKNIKDLMQAIDDIGEIKGLTFDEILYVRSIYISYIKIKKGELTI